MIINLYQKYLFIWFDFYYHFLPFNHVCKQQILIRQIGHLIIELLKSQIKLFADLQLFFQIQKIDQNSIFFGLFLKLQKFHLKHSKFLINNFGKVFLILFKFVKKWQIEQGLKKLLLTLHVNFYLQKLTLKCI